MGLLLYVLGFVVVISGLASLATLAGVAPGYVLAGAGILLVVAISTTIVRSRGAA
jgi:hypothetical protein